MLATLALGTTAAALSCCSAPAGIAGVTAGAVAFGFGSSTFGNIAGNLATDVLKEFDRRTADRWFAASFGIDQNHKVLEALRRAHIAALRDVLSAYDKRRPREGTEASTADIEADERFVAALWQLLREEDREARNATFGLKGPVTPAEEEVRQAVLHALGDGFDAALAQRRLPQGLKDAGAETLQRVQQGIEAAALAEMRALLRPAPPSSLRRLLGERAPAGAVPIPSAFEAAFRGDGVHGAGWFDAFIRDTSHRLGTDPEFLARWQNEQLSAVRALLVAQGREAGNLREVAAAMTEGLKTLLPRLEALESGVAELLRLQTELQMQRGYDRIEPETLAWRPTEIVVAKFGLIPFDDSRGLLGTPGDGPEDTVLGWATGPGAKRVRLLHAAGGWGKTRLALEALTRLNALGWQAGLLSHMRLEAALDPARDLLARLFARRGPAGVFLAIDYAETRPEQIKRLAEVLAATAEGGPIRVLLLARTDGWWAECIRQVDPAHRGPFEPQARDAAETALAPAAVPAVLAAACTAFARMLGKAPRQENDPPLVIPGWDRTPPESYGDGNPLDLALRAYLRVRSVGVKGSPLATMAEEERRHLHRALRQEVGGDPRKPVDELTWLGAAAITLLGGLLPTQLEQRLPEIIGVLTAPPARPTSQQEQDAIMAGLRLLYGREDGGLDPILPDLLGEQMIGEALARRPALVGDLLDTVPEDRLRALVIANRVTRTDAKGQPAHDGLSVVAPTRVALRGALASRLADPALAEALLLAIPTERGCLEVEAETVLTAMSGHVQVDAAVALVSAAEHTVSVNAVPAQLRGLLAEAARIASQVAPSGEDLHSLAERARQANNRGVLLSNAGRREEALAASEEAVRLRRELVAQNRAAFLPDLASALNNLGSDFSSLGRREEALAASEEAVRVYGELVAQNRAAFLPDLASSLGARGQALLAAGQASAAAACFEEGAALTRPLAENLPDAFKALFEALARDLVQALEQAGEATRIPAVLAALGLQPPSAV